MLQSWHVSMCGLAGEGYMWLQNCEHGVSRKFSGAESNKTNSACRRMWSVCGIVQVLVAVGLLSPS